VARFDSISLTQVDTDRVRISGTKGEAPPSTLKVTANLNGGWRNSMTLAITGALPTQKAAMAAEAVWGGIPGGAHGFAETAEDLSGDLTGGGMAFLRLAVRGDDEHAVGRAFSGAVVETSLSSYPGTFFTSAPSNAQAVARYWPTLIEAAEVSPVVICDGQPVAVSPRTTAFPPPPPPVAAFETPANPAVASTDTLSIPLWVLVGGRSGDKGGAANVGLWADSEEVAQWLQERFDVSLFRQLLPEADGFEVERHALPNLRALNFMVRGILGWGVASNLRLDTQAKGLAELIRSRKVDVPASFVQQGKPAVRWASTHANS
jgi:hypothetical protein